nr:MAG TPA: hypothetical protein [Caudoviricetes sp.]
MTGGSDGRAAGGAAGVLPDRRGGGRRGRADPDAV